jgi:hypothetical protein
VAECVHRRPIRPGRRGSAFQNEDANPNLVIIDPRNHTQSAAYPFNAAPHGGGYDDIVFRGCKVYISASNPSRNPNTGPTIVSARLDNGIVKIEPLLMGDAKAIDVGPIFRRLIGRDEIGDGLHPGSIAPIFKRVAQWIGMPARFVAEVSGQSTRVGAAQDLAELDIDLAAIT